MLDRRLAAHRLRARRRVRAARGGRVLPRRPARRWRARRSSSTPSSCSSRWPRRRASSTCRRATRSTPSTSAATTWCSRASTGRRSCARATCARDAKMARLRELRPARAGVPRARLRRRHGRRAGGPPARLAPPRHGLRAPDAVGQALHGLGDLGRERARHDRDGRDPVRRREALERAPVSISLINCNSPLRWDDRMLSAMLEYNRANQAVDRHAVPPDGRDVAGVDPGHARAADGRGAAGIALTQLVQPGCPVVFGSFLSNTDMQSGSPSFGTPESAIGLLCTGQIARHFGLPFRSGGGLTSSQTAGRPGGLRGADDDAPDVPRRRQLRHARRRLARGRARVVLREVHRRHRDPADAQARVPRRSRSTRTRSRSAPTRRSAPAGTSSAPRTRSSTSATASTGRCCPRPRTSTAGRRTAARTPPSARGGSRRRRSTTTSSRRSTTRCATSCATTSPAAASSSATSRSRPRPNPF